MGNFVNGKWEVSGKVPSGSLEWIAPENHARVRTVTGAIDGVPVATITRRAKYRFVVAVPGWKFAVSGVGGIVYLAEVIYASLPVAKQVVVEVLSRSIG